MKLWLVGQVILSVWNHQKNEWQVGGQWDVQGIFDNEDAAVAICKTENYFIMPLMLNQELPHDKSETPEGSRYPLAKV